MLAFSKFKCPKANPTEKETGIKTGDTKPQSITVRFSEAFNPLVILGYSDTGDALYREGVSNEDQKKDMLLEFTCPHQWQVREALHYNNHVAEKDILDYHKKNAKVDGKKSNPVNATKEWEDIEKYLLDGVDPATCKAKININSTEPNGALALWKDGATREAALDSEYRTQENGGLTWDRVRFTVFSMVVSASFFAAYNITTFYTGVTVLAGGAVRLAFLLNSYKQWVYETTHPDSIIKVVEACYLYRHEENLELEEECYRMLQEIFR